MSDYAQQQQAAGKPFSLGEFFARINAAGTIPFALVETETVTSAADRGTPVPDSLYEINSTQRSEEHTSELQSQSNLVCRLLLEKKKNQSHTDARSAQHDL